MAKSPWRTVLEPLEHGEQHRLEEMRQHPVAGPRASSGDAAERRHLPKPAAAANCSSSATATPPNAATSPSKRPPWQRPQPPSQRDAPATDVGDGLTKLRGVDDGGYMDVVELSMAWTQMWLLTIRVVEETWERDERIGGYPGKVGNLLYILCPAFSAVPSAASFSAFRIVPAMATTVAFPAMATVAPATATVPAAATDTMGATVPFRQWRSYV
ncbi:hypothetical protein OsI_21410 [Oryza sativa Indica Group]|uniref:Uncharacterized protein n=2 Tax=Oryza sativa TaxID=4530 RepID=B9FR87_ORYSJ|nr:hypothetical protein OsI_21410 [Oryza sativa Indica Group]EEE64998.1 hypothetical protein OsJ_19927 [Oryza sativa Japonica Group]